MSGENKVDRHVLLDPFKNCDIRAVKDLYGPSFA